MQNFLLSVEVGVIADEVIRNGCMFGKEICIVVIANCPHTSFKDVCPTSSALCNECTTTEPRKRSNLASSKA